MNHSVRRIDRLAERLDARKYLEIGVRDGSTIFNVKIPHKTGVDPDFQFNVQEKTDHAHRFIADTSDEFFAREPLGQPYDVVFIDGLHKFEQVVRDFSNTLLRTHTRSAIIIDDTVPDDPYAALADLLAVFRLRKSAGITNASWQGDVFKVLFYIHDFWPSLNYRTIMGSGNPQTLVWRSNGLQRKPLFDSLERISRLTYFELQDHLDVLKMASETEAIDLCIAELKSDF